MVCPAHQAQSPVAAQPITAIIVRSPPIGELPAPRRQPAQRFFFRRAVHATEIAVEMHTSKRAKAARVVEFGQLGRVVKSANLLGILIDSHIMANAANAANAFTTGRG